MKRAKAVKIVGKGGPEVLQLGDLEVREPGAGELLVEVAAAGLNRADILQRRGFYPAPAGVPADVPGLEYAGRVAQVGEGVDDFRVGDPVMGIVGGGGMATHLCVHAREAIRAPQGMDLADAAALPEVFLTAYDALFVQAKVTLGEVVLIHAAVPTPLPAAVQLARGGGARPVGTSRSQSKLDRCRELGLEDGICVSDGRFADALQQQTGGRLADVVLDTVGAAYLAENIKALATGGRMVVIGLLGGAKGELPLGALLPKRASLCGTVLRSRPLEDKAVLAQRVTRELLPLFERGALRPVVDSVMPMAEVQQAHQRMESNESFGKIVLTW